jgi:MYXO-CTERM domain-containing protein
MLRGMSEVGGLGDKAQELKAQVAQRAREVRAQAVARAPQLRGVVVQNVQRVVQDKPGAAMGAVLAVLGLLLVRRRQRRRRAKKIRQSRGRFRASRIQWWMRGLAVLGLLMRRRRRRKEDS